MLKWVFPVLPNCKMTAFFLSICPLESLDSSSWSNGTEQGEGTLLQAIYSLAISRARSIGHDDTFFFFLHYPFYNLLKESLLLG